jgi:hypothetical protein
MSTKPSVEAVVINWKRPRNVARIVAALRTQTVPCTITICDCHPEPDFALDDETVASIDRRYRWTHNTGAFSRFVPAGAFDHAYTFFLDDDMLPGERCVEHFLDAAERVQSFGALGQQGRILEPDGVYRAVQVARHPGFREVDVLVRGYFVPTAVLHQVFALRWRMGYFHDDPHPEDDLLLCVALQVLEGLPCYLTPASDEPQTLANYAELDNEHALFRRPDHLERRTRFLRDALEAGWKPLHARERTQDDHS